MDFHYIKCPSANYVDLIYINDSGIVINTFNSISYPLIQFTAIIPGSCVNPISVWRVVDPKQSTIHKEPAKVGGNKKLQEVLTAEEYSKLMHTPCLNHEVKKAFIFSFYTGLRWIDVKSLSGSMIKNNSVSIIQNKRNIPLEIPLHSIAKSTLGERKEGLVFQLPTQDGANKILGKWCMDAKLNKHITWHCARHSFSVLLQQKGVDIATIAGILGHTSSKYVHDIYKRYMKIDAEEAIQKLPF
jgi:integrase/recombinase XerD